MPARAEEIARAFGLRRAGREYVGKCPSCAYASGFTVTERDSRVLLYCAAGGCSQADLWAALGKAGCARSGEATAPRSRRRTTAPAKVDSPSGELATPPKLVVDRATKEEAAQQAALAIWRRSRPIAGTVAEAYLRYRGYTGPLPPALRFATGKHPADGQFHPMLVAAVVIAGRMDQATAIHRTFIRADGLGKAALDPQKMSLGPIAGASIPLAPAGPVLVIGEGIETTLSVAQACGLPGWAAVSSGNMPELILPPSVGEILIAADRDPAGLAAAYAAARRWHACGRKIRVIIPPEGAGDFNDVARRNAS
jgi:phage/plasmid primase-like uncharacterized protein